MRERTGRYTRAFLIAGLVLLMMLLPAGSYKSMAAGKDAVVIKTISGGTWKRTGNHVQYLAGGKPVTGWKRISGKIYYFRVGTGYRVTGKRLIGKYYYYFDSTGVRKTGLVTISGKKYLFNRNNYGRMQTGWFTNNLGTYYFAKATGIMSAGWKRIGRQYYYFKPSTGKMMTGWLTLNGKTYYLDPKTGARATGKVTIGSVDYYFNNNGVLYAQDYGDNSEIYSAGRTMYRSTIKKMLQIALQPVGSTMYVYGGGWNLTNRGEDAAYITARTLGVSPKWKAFFNQQSSSYNYRNHYLKDVDKGLDCSGYVGWVLYNTFMRESGLEKGFVMQAQNMTRTFAGYGWGSYTSAGRMDHKAGDIMSLAAGHVYIVIGECSDGSVVLVHSSPNGVQLTGTCSSSGKKNSQANQLATSYMRRYFPQWYAKYPDSYRGKSYLTDYSRMRWYLTGEKAVLSDPDGLTGMSAQEVLKVIFNEK